jgi:predicted nucleic acid-binding protein
VRRIAHRGRPGTGGFGGNDPVHAYGGVGGDAGNGGDGGAGGTGGDGGTGLRGGDGGSGNSGGAGGLGNPTPGAGGTGTGGTNGPGAQAPMATPVRPEATAAQALKPCLAAYENRLQRLRGRIRYLPGLLDRGLRDLRKAVLGGHLSNDDAEAAFQALIAMQIEYVGTDIVLLQAVWAMRDNISVYDSAYLAVAAMHDAPLVTFDTRLADAADRVQPIIVSTCSDMRHGYD